MTDEQKNLVKELTEQRCRVCGIAKGRGKTFCYRCFKSLPFDIQNALYSKIGEGYEEAHLKAVEFLRANAE